MTKTRKHSSRMCTVRLLTRGMGVEGFLHGTTLHGTPFIAPPSWHPFTETPFTESPFTDPPFMKPSLMEPLSLHHSHGQTNTSENITFQQLRLRAVITILRWLTLFRVFLCVEVKTTLQCPKKRTI